MTLVIVQWKLCLESVIMVSHIESMRHSIAEFLKSFKDQTRPISLLGGLPYWWLEAVMKEYPIWRNFSAITRELHHSEFIHGVFKLDCKND